MEGAAIELTCQRCSYTWPYTGSKRAAARSGAYPVYTSCPRCRNSNVAIRDPPAGEPKSGPDSPNDAGSNI